MKKLSLLTVLAVIAFGSKAFAADFPITATIPAATQVLYKVSVVTPGTPPSFASQTGNSLNFATAGTGMSYSTANQIWTASRFFAIDLSPSDASGNPAPVRYGTITLAYSANVVPSGQAATEGLNKRGTLTAVKVVGTTETTLRKANIGSTFAALSDSDVQGGFLRVYVGLATGETWDHDTNPSTPNVPVVPGSVPFTNGDKPGTYTGTLTITATLV